MKHIFFSGIGGTGIGPLALIAKQAGFAVSGSDKQESQYTKYLQSHGIDLYIGQTKNALLEHHAEKPIDWFVYSSALPLENPNHPEIAAVNELGITHTKRDSFLAYFLQEKNLNLIAFAGTHGKTSSTAMAIWAAKQLAIPISYSVGAKLSYGDMGHYDPESEYFLYECDEFDRNFLAYHPNISVLTKVDWDHHEQYPTRNSYIGAFKQFCTQSETIIAHDEEINYLGITSSPNVRKISKSITSSVNLHGEHNRRNAAGVITALSQISNKDDKAIVSALNTYPGSSRRFEKIAHNIYTDYAHTPEEIAATLQLAREYGKNIIVAYEPLTNRRQHYMIDQYIDTFTEIESLFWLPSYLAREDPNQHIITPEEFIAKLPANIEAKPATLSNELKNDLIRAAEDGKLVLLLAGGGGGSLDEWARINLVTTD